MSELENPIHTEAQSAPFLFDIDKIEVPINLTPKAETPTVAWHRLRRPTLEELNEFISSDSVEWEEHGKREDKLIASSEAPSVKLWDKIATHVRGYKGQPDWVDVGAEARNKVRAPNKVTAIRRMYASTAEIEYPEGGISMGGDEWTVRQAIGVDPESPEAVIKYLMREPTEAERRTYRKDVNSTFLIKGSKKGRGKMTSHLKPAVLLFDALVLRVDGGAVVEKRDDQEIPLSWDAAGRTRFLAGIDPLYKKLVVDTFLSEIESDLLD